MALSPSAQLRSLDPNSPAVKRMNAQDAARKAPALGAQTINQSQKPITYDTSGNTGLLSNLQPSNMTKQQGLLSPYSLEKINQGTPAVARIGLQAQGPQNNVKPIKTTLASKDQASKSGEYFNVNGLDGTSGGSSSSGGNSGATGGSVVNNTSGFNAQGQPSYPGIIGGLIQKSQGPSADYTAQQAEANRYNEALKQSRINEAQGLAANAQNPIPLEFQQGRAQVMQSQYAQEQAALGAGYQGAAALQGAANTQQGLQLGGLGTAAGLAAPQQVGPTNVPFNPITGQYGQPAAGAYGTGGLQSVGNIQGQIGIGNTVANLNANLGGANVVGQNLQSLITKSNINPFDVQFLNGMTQYLQKGVLSNPQYQEFAGQVNELINSLAPILGAGGSATDMKTQMASQIINAQASGKSMNDVIQYFLDQAKQKIQGFSQGGGAGVGSSNSSGGGLYNF